MPVGMGIARTLVSELYMLAALEATTGCSYPDKKPMTSEPWAGLLVESNDSNGGLSLLTTTQVHQADVQRSAGSDTRK